MKNGPTRHEVKDEDIVLARRGDSTGFFEGEERSASNVIHNTGTLIVMYDKAKKNPSGNADWWWLTECLMLAAYAIVATVWIILAK